MPIFTFRFGGPRNPVYHVMQIFVPILLIAFSFSLSDNCPRLGYVTLLDVFMVIMCVVNSSVAAYNVWLRRLEMSGQGDLAERIDSYFEWFYSLSYAVDITATYKVFF